jgi:hypothetical protein
MKIMKRIFMKKSVFLAILLTGGAAAFSVSADADAQQQIQELRTSLITDAKKYIGTPYAYGAVGPDTFDCSGFIFTVSRESTGYQLPRTVKALYSFVRIIPDSKKEPGDIVFFHTTGGSTISHAGIYIGNDQFIHAASDGPNTGVILSSLKENYWKTAYSGAGQFLPADQNEKEEQPVAENRTEAVQKTACSKNGTGSGFNSFLKNAVVDASFGIDWNFLTPERFMLNLRGIVLQTVVSYSAWDLQPGIGMMLRYNTGVGCFQLPVVFTLTLNDYLRMYIGPVITFGSPELPDTGEPVEASVFPGIIGVSWQTPPLTKGKVKVTLTQDIFYTVFNDTNGAALSLSDSIAAGLVFSTGIRVTLPFSGLLQ